MRKRLQFRMRSNNRLAFFQGFLRHPNVVGSILPSSRFLEKRIIQMADVASANMIIELGPGTGGTTRALLRAMNREAKLLCVEVCPEFIPILENIGSSQLIVQEGSAHQLSEVLAEYQLPSPDLVVSGIPFSMFDYEFGKEIVEEIFNALAPEGRFVGYQLRERLGLIGREVFGKPVVENELLNFPPVRVYRWEKSSEAAVSQAV